MDDELRKAFATLSGQMSDVARDSRESASRSQEAAHGVALLRGDFVELRRDVDRLKAHVFGSEPPPASPTEPITRTLNDHDNDIATLTGQIIATRAELKDVKAQNEEQLELLRTVTKSVGGFLGHPVVRRLAWGVGVAVTGWMATKGWLH